MSKWRYVMIMLMGCLLLTKPASAHVLIRDTSGSLGAILHMTPDDDPIAGESSSLFFDLQGEAFSRHQHSVILRISDESGRVADVGAKLAGSTVTARYTFPRQGIYRIALYADSSSTTRSHVHIFRHTQRVARGVSGSPLDEPTHAWAEAGLVAALAGLVLLGIIATNRRREIARSSQ